MSDDAIRCSLERLEEKLDRTIDHRHKNGIKMTEIKGVVDSNANYIREHKDWHVEERKHWRGLNAKIWVAIGVSIGIPLILALVNGNVI